MPKHVIVVQGAPALEAIPYFLPISQVAEVRLANDTQALREALPGADILLGWDFKADQLEAAWQRADSLRWIHWSGAGVDALLFDALMRSEVTLTNARGIFDRAMAEYVLALVLGLAKRLPETVRLQTSAQWQHRLTERIDGRRALVVGVGSIGRSIARLLRAVGMRVSGVARRARNEDAEFERVFPASELHEALRDADYVLGVLPATGATQRFFGADAFAAMKPGAKFVNVGRGTTVDDAALLTHLASGHLSGAALDVFTTEPLPASNPLWALPNVIVSPHMSGDFNEYADDLGWLFARNFSRYSRALPLLNRVDKTQGY
ncbi:MAG: phosphoglycerate dehydrogenase-like enzyme [Gammaproteobacteria bacterium]|jgi:phosphoglycerate dehydrogenase-like enzyme